MRPGLPRRRPPRLAGAGAILGLLVSLLAPYGVIPRPGPSGAIDRTLGIVFARHRPADAVADDRSLPPLSTPALPPPCTPAVMVPGPAACSLAGDARQDLASRPAPPGRPRSPPVS